MRSSPTNNNNTLLKIQQEINEVAARESELRTLYQRQNTNSIDNHELPNNVNQISNGLTNGNNGNRSPSPISPSVSPVPPILSRSLSTGVNTNTRAAPPVAPVPMTHGTSNGINTNTTRRLFIQNPNNATKGVMQKFFKSRGKLTSSVSLPGNVIQPTLTRSTTINTVSWEPAETLNQPAKALIPSDKPLRKGYVPVEEKIQKELRELKQREEELRTERRKSQPDLMAALEREQQENSIASTGTSRSNSRSSSPIPFPGRLRNSKSFSQLLDDDINFADDNNAMLNPLRPAKSLAELCDISDDEVIEKPKNLIQQWESRIRQSQETN